MQCVAKTENGKRTVAGVCWDYDCYGANLCVRLLMAAPPELTLRTGFLSTVYLHGVSKPAYSSHTLRLRQAAR